MAWTGFFGRLMQPNNPRTVALMQGLLVQERPNLKSMAIFDPEIINFEKMQK